MKTLKFIYRLVIVICATGMVACASLPPNTDRTESYAYEDIGETGLSRLFDSSSAGKTGESAFYLLDDALDAFVARIHLARIAEGSIDTQYYMIHDDVVGSLFIDSLYQAAERGVRVRLLVDDMDQEGRDTGAAILDSHPNVEVRIFNPFSRDTVRAVQFITGFGRQTRRAHNKSFTVDNQATILGGRNIGDEYFNADPELAFMDLDLLSVGPVAHAVSSSFDLYWNNELSYPISSLVKNIPTGEESAQRKKQFDEFVAQQYESQYLQHLRDSDLAQLIGKNSANFSWGRGEVVADDPRKLAQDTSNTEYRLTEQLRPYMEGVETELIIFSPYFVPGKAGVAFLKTLREKGVRVRILTNSLSSTDVSAVHAGYSRYRRELLRIGVELYELNKNLSAVQRKAMEEGGIGSSKASLHAKSFVLDRKKIFIGSLNLDPRSVIQNTEIGVVFDSTELAQHMADSFDRKIDEVAFRLELLDDDQGQGRIVWHGSIDGEQQTIYVDPYAGFWKRFGVGFMGMLSIESQI